MVRLEHLMSAQRATSSGASGDLAAVAENIEGCDPQRLEGRRIGRRREPLTGYSVMSSTSDTAVTL